MEKEIRLLPLREAKTITMKEEMQEAFQHGFQSYYKEDNKWQVLPDKDFYQSLEAEGAEAYEAIDTDGQRVGGAIIAIDGNGIGEIIVTKQCQCTCRCFLQYTNTLFL